MKLLLLLLLLFSSFINAQVFESIFFSPEPGGDWRANLFSNVLIKRDSTVVFCSGGTGNVLTYYQNGNWQHLGSDNYSFATSNTAKRELEEDSDGNIWIVLGYDAYGIDKYNGITVSHYSNLNSNLLGGYFKDIAGDNFGRIFLTYSGIGFSMLKNNIWYNNGDFTDGLSLLNTFTDTEFIEFDKTSNTIWTTSGGNFHQILEDTVLTYTPSSSGFPSLAAYAVVSMTSTTNGDVWFALNKAPYSKGLLKYDGANWFFFDSNNSLELTEKVTSITSYGDSILFKPYGVDSLGIFNGTNWRFIDDNNSNFPANFECTEVKSLNDTFYFSTNSGIVILKINETPSSNYRQENSSILDINISKTKDDIYISANEINTNLYINLYSIEGKLVYSNSFTNKIDISFLPEGLYNILIFRNDNHFYKKTFIK